MPTTKVIDLCSDNKIPENLRYARAAGVVGMIHRATTGTDEADEKAEARVFLAKDAGMLTGLYHVMGSGPVREQLDFFLETADELGLQDNWLLAVQPPEGADSFDQLVEFMKDLEKESRRSPVLFSGHDTLDKMQAEENKLKQYRLWISHFDPVVDVPAAWGKYFLWQYTDAGEVEGVTPPVNCNDSLLEDEALAKQWSGFKGKVDDSLPEAVPPAAEGAEDLQEPTKTPEGELEHGVPDTPSEGGVGEEGGEHPPPQG